MQPTVVVWETGQMKTRRRHLLRLTLGAVLVFCLILFLLPNEWTAAALFPRDTVEHVAGASKDSKPVRAPELGSGPPHKEATSNRFFSKPSLERRASQKQATPAQATTSTSWYLDGPEHPTAITNTFKLGRRSITIISRKQINSEAVEQHLKARAEMDAQIEKSAHLLKVRATNLQVGMSVEQAVEVMGSHPSSSAPRPFDGTLLWAYSTHPELVRPAIGNRFPVLYVSFDATDRVSEWRFSSR